MHTINITEARNLGTLYCCGVSDRSRSNEMIREKRYKGRPVACHSGPENVPVAHSPQHIAHTVAHRDRSRDVAARLLSFSIYMVA